MVIFHSTKSPILQFVAFTILTMPRSQIGFPVVLLVPFVSLVKLEPAETLFTKVPLVNTSNHTVKLAFSPTARVPIKVHLPSSS